jgi:hypothetical protein
VAPQNRCGDQNQQNRGQKNPHGRGHGAPKPGDQIAYKGRGDDDGAGADHADRHRDVKEYRGRTWATREHLWIDRVCSAWLIQRFIDPKARFVWLKRPKDCPKRAIGFDFDGAPFTHVDSKVTFEVLVASFGLDTNPALTRLGALVHFLDVGGIPVPEAAGLATIVSGARTLQRDDSALLQYVSPVLDSIYSAFLISDHEGAAQ